ncbi:hypothetical protein CAter10_2527 [Collimonas arenae]|uniref:hypothetical protein n=1 Tax=Collimonas arenae TaxID=279058 RepID=UPI00078D9EC2|nr:hypothetical protein [Collimonas arenae]AMP00173.1 hypothetical protein CAter10_2527 [Collimonas arenae]
MNDRKTISLTPGQVACVEEALILRIAFLSDLISSRSTASQVRDEFFHTINALSAVRGAK